MVAGPDGSGKSTVARAVVERLEREGSSVRHVHVEPLAVVRPGGVADPHARRLHSGAGSLAALGARWCRYQLFAARGWGGAARRTTVVQERGWLDQAVDPVRYRLTGGVAALVGPLRRTVRRPDLVILCEGEPTAIAARKGELTAAETARQLGAWRRLLTQERLVSVDTTLTAPPETIDAAWAAVDDLRRAGALPLSARTVVMAPRRVGAVATAGAAPALERLLRPVSARGRSFRKVSLLLTRAGIRGRAAVAPFPLEALAGALGVPWDAFGLIRSHGRRRWVVGLCRSGSLTSVVKVAPAGEVALAREAALLERLEGRAGRLVVPRVQRLVQVQGWLALGLEPVEGGVRLRADLDEALAVSLELARALDGRGVTHGDLAPWNLMAGDPGAVVDWEAGTDRFVPGADLLHYAVSVSRGRAGVALDGQPVYPVLLRYCEALDLDRDTVLADLETRWRRHCASLGAVR